MNNTLLIVVIILVMIWLVKRQLQERRIKVVNMWILPLIMLYLSYNVMHKDFVADMFHILVIMLGFVIGILLGILRGALTEIRVDPHSKEIIAKGSLIGVIVWLILIGIKLLLRQELTGIWSHANLITSGLLALSLGDRHLQKSLYFLEIQKAEQLNRTKSACASNLGVQALFPFFYMNRNIKTINFISDQNPSPILSQSDLIL
jgi:hypothetical protein